MFQSKKSAPAKAVKSGDASGEKPAKAERAEKADKAEEPAVAAQSAGEEDKPEENEGPSGPPKIKRRSKKWAENVPWANTESTTLLYQLIQSNDVSTLEDLLAAQPDAVHMRSEDGRGPLWWAHEFDREEIIDVLTKYKVGYHLHFAPQL